VAWTDREQARQHVTGMSSLILCATLCKDGYGKATQARILVEVETRDMSNISNIR
jgi:hypothetical protein